MANLALFTNILDETGPKILNGPQMVHYLADRRNYQMQYWMFRGRKMSDVLSGGDELKKRVKGTVGANAGFYRVGNTEHAPVMPNDGTWLNSYWTFHMGHTAYQIEPLMINAGGTKPESEIKETYVTEAWNLLQSLKIAIQNSLDDIFFRKPDASLMSGTDPEVPLSIPAYLNGYANGLYVPGSAVGSTFTELHGLTTASPDFARYRPYVKSYGSGAGTGFTPGVADNIIRALSSCVNRTKMQPPAMDSEFWAPEDSMDIEQGGFIACSDYGSGSMAQLYVNAQDRWSDFSDPKNFPKYRGIPFVYVSTLDDAKLYPNNDTIASSTDTETETAAAVIGPRFYGINPNWMKMYWHRDAFVNMLPLYRIGLTTYQQAALTMCSMTCHDRQAHFFLQPAVDHPIT